jgi:hypothetical protein
LGPEGEVPSPGLDVPDDPDSLDELEEPLSVLPEFDVAAVSPDDEPPSPDDEPPSPDDFAPADERELLELPRSFFAQPDPLKWIVGGANSLRIVPSSPHEGQKSGPGSFRPWRMSVRWSQAVQAYS